MMWVMFVQKQLKDCSADRDTNHPWSENAEIFFFLYYLKRLEQTILLHWFEKTQQTNFPVVTNNYYSHLCFFVWQTRSGGKIFRSLSPCLSFFLKKGTHGIFCTRGWLPSSSVPRPGLVKHLFPLHTVLSMHSYLRSINDKHSAWCLDTCLSMGSTT